MPGDRALMSTHRPLVIKTTKRKIKLTPLTEKLNLNYLPVVFHLVLQKTNDKTYCKIFFCNS